MYAVIEQGSKQYKVAEGDCLNIDLTDVAPDAKTIELGKAKRHKSARRIWKAPGSLPHSKPTPKMLLSKARSSIQRTCANAKTAGGVWATGRNICR